MAIMDARGLFGMNFDLDQEPGTFLFTNQIDLEIAGRDPGQGQIVYLNFVVTEAFTDGGGTGTLQIRLRSDDSAAIHATSSTGHLETGTMLKTALTLGKQFSFALPAEGVAYERFLGLQAIVATEGFDAGMITAWLGIDSVGSKTFPDASN